MSRVLDAHHHLWRYSEAEFGWIDDSMAALRRDFPVSELEAEAARAGVDGTIAVQARQTLEETRWLLDVARESALVCGVVGWADIAGAEFEASLAGLMQDKKLVGLRHVVQAEPEGFLDGAAFHGGMGVLQAFGLVYDLLIQERQLEEAIRFVDRHPRQVFVLDHMAKPRIAAAEMEPWRARMREMARRDNVSCKVSGMVTEADWSGWSAEGLAPYFDVVLEAFGPKRLMAGSDWPVCLVASGYAPWWDVLRAQFAGCSEAERAEIFGGCAARVYGV